MDGEAKPSNHVETLNKEEESKKSENRRLYGQLLIVLIIFVIVYEYYIYVYQIQWKSYTSN